MARSDAVDYCFLRPEVPPTFWSSSWVYWEGKSSTPGALGWPVCDLHWSFVICFCFRPLKDCVSLIAGLCSHTYYFPHNILQLCFCHSPKAFISSASKFGMGSCGLLDCFSTENELMASPDKNHFGDRWCTWPIAWNDCRQGESRSRCFCFPWAWSACWLCSGSLGGIWIVVLLIFLRRVRCV